MGRAGWHRAATVPLSKYWGAITAIRQPPTYKPSGNNGDGCWGGGRELSFHDLNLGRAALFHPAPAPLPPHSPVGLRGPVLLEDYHLVEELAQFDRERIPERVVHARGTVAKGFFEVRRGGRWGCRRVQSAVREDLHARSRRRV